MEKADLLRVQDVRDAYRLIGQCRDLGSDPALWHQRMLEGLCRLVGARAAAGGEGRWVRPHSPIEVISAFDAGLDSRGRDLYMASLREVGPDRDPIFRALRHVPSRHVTRTRQQLVPDGAWYRSAIWNEYQRPIGIDHRSRRCTRSRLTVSSTSSACTAPAANERSLRGSNSSSASSTRSSVR
jgi:hypothetical protein